MVNEQRYPVKHDIKHDLMMNNRESLKATGILKVDSFDEREIVLETQMGALIIKGENLHINQFSLEEGILVISGMIKSLDYPEERAKLKQKGKGFLERILK